MTQMTVWLDNDANPSIIKKVLQNMKGVKKISLQKDKKKISDDEKKEQEWIKELHRLVNNVDRTKIDTNDEKTRYILSK